jgi:hypothetical protein
MKNRVFWALAFWLVTAGVSGQQTEEAGQAAHGVPAVQAEPEPVSAFVALEDSLKKLALHIIEPLEDSARLENNRLFYRELVRVLEKDDSFHHPFDSLQTVSMLTAPDSSFRIITWYVPLYGQRFEYFGIIQPYVSDRSDTSNGDPGLIHLRDSTSRIGSAVFSELSPDRWFGAYYYEVIHERSGNTDLYTLLGWKGDNPHTRLRVVEPLWFRNGEPVFGKQVFRIGQRDPYRVVFEYAAMAAMNLVYANHPVIPGQPAREMIVFDRLSPGDESLRGHYRFYLPEANILDALVFEEDRWVFYPDVDARAPQPPPEEE